MPCSPSWSLLQWDSPPVVATNFSLSALADEHRSWLLILAVAGDWSTASQLKELELLSTSRGFVPPGRRANFWPRLLNDWAEIGLVERRDSHYATRYLLNRALAHDVLRSANSIVLGRLHESLSAQTWQDENRLSQSARVSLYIGDSSRFISTMTHAAELDWGRLFGADPPPEVFALVPPVLREQYLEHLAENALQLRAPMSGVVWSSAFSSLDPYRIAVRALRGEISLDSDLLIGLAPETDKSGRLHAALALVSLSSGNVAAAQVHGARALALSTGRQSYPALRGALGSWAALCALSGNPKQFDMGELLVSGVGHHQTRELDDTEEFLQAFVNWQKAGSEKPLGESASDGLRDLWSPLTWVVREILVSWGALQPLQDDVNSDERAEVQSELAGNGYDWVSRQYSALIASGNQSSILASMFVPKELWERRLDRLSGLAVRLDRDAARKDEAEQRLVWILGSSDSEITLEARIQRKTRTGFTKGRKAIATTLVGRHDERWIDAADRAGIRAATRIVGSKQESGEYRFGLASTLALVGHPRVFWDVDFEPAEIVRVKPRIDVLRKGSTIEVSPHPWHRTEGAWAERDGTRLLAYDVDAQHVRLCEALGAPKSSLPADAEPRLAGILGHLSKNISLHSDVVPEGVKVKEVPAEAGLILKLRRDRDMLRIRVVVRPFGKTGPVFDAGRGTTVVVTDIDSVATQTTRDLQDEQKREAALYDACPSLHRAELRDRNLILFGLGHCLELIEELHRLGDEVVCLWSEGEPIRFDLAADIGGLRVHFGDTKAWLTADIEVKVSEELTLKAHDLVSRMVAGANKYVQLDDGRFLKLSEELSKKLSNLSALGSMREGGVEIAPSSAFALSAWLGDLGHHDGVKGAKLANERLSKVRESTELITAVPSEFKAELRSYQGEAFQWLSRLAYWGGGALLCDDMGLGKTVQMLAVLVDRASKGPALVVAPVSVAPHWIDLMHKFAPTLRPKELEASGRAEAFASLGPQDVLIVSYGLLHSEVELLSSRRFQSIVLDEAQAIKNPRSLRARAAHRLQGDFRVITTGTPIENHLGELWSLMNFANPGLFGTAREFSDTYGKPIQKEGSQEASAGLRRMLRPFLLRRTKAQVLDELPPKTEITLAVEPSPEEAEYYVAIRDAMLAEIQAGRSRPGHQRMQILAALMKLRRLACHPKLIDESVDFGSAKQNTFMELVTELREAGHRILVFSQFVGHLAIARSGLEDKNISYQYLDGQTSKAKRKTAVAAFQAGEGDVFLISLRAGGVGLDLTGADYVIHLDPWWNPAVEDQASDRAHRIGQKRPVTVYRLVTKGTVEESVLELHGRKRKLAEDLISGNESAGALGVDELVNLMRDAGSQ